MTTPSQAFGNKCRKCDVVLSEKNVYLKFYRGNLCIECQRKQGREKTAKYRKENYQRYRELGRTASQKYYRKIKKVLFEGYDNKCSCCAESEPKFLSIDHVNNDGNIERGSRKNPKSGSYGINLYKKIIEQNFPTRYQLLCMNCNFGKRMNNGICPHKTNDGPTTISPESTAK